MKTKLCAVLAAFLTLANSTSLAASLQKKALIIGVDGTMSQYLAVARTTNLNALKAAGAFTDRAITAPVTHSAACWSSMFTGVWGDKNGVQDPGNNMSSNKFSLYPNFLKRLEQVNSNYNTVAFTRWCPLSEALAGVDLVTCYSSDAALTDATCNHLTNSNPDVMYTILLDVDSAGHSPGWGTATYVSAIETADARIGRMMSALTNRVTYTNEDWLVIILADHGQHDSTPERARFTFHLAWGPSVARGALYPIPSIVDVCATVLTHMGVPIDPAWNLDARVEGLPLPPVRYGTNLIFNGGAESDSGTNFYRPDRGAAWWWDYTGTTLATYGAFSNFLSQTDTGPAERGNTYFLGGTNATTFISQTINISDLAQDVDGPGVEYRFSGWLGGSGTDSNSAIITMRFLDSTNGLVGTNFAGPVTRANRAGVPSLLERSTNGTLPANTRFVEFTLRLTSTSPTNNAAADNLSFVLSPACVGNYQLYTHTMGGGQVQRIPSMRSYPCGAIVTNLAVPDKDWTFMGWIGDMESTNPTATLRMTADSCAEAVFGTPLTLSTAGNGTVLLEPVSLLYPFGSQVRATAVPANGYYFVDWTGTIEDTNSPLQLEVTNAAPGLTATFLPLPPDQFTFTHIAHGKGSISTLPEQAFYPSGTVITNIACAQPGQTFLRWSGETNGAVIGGTNLVLTLGSNRVIEAWFTTGPSLQFVPCNGTKPTNLPLLITGQVGDNYQVQRATELYGGPAPLTNGNWITLGNASNTVGKSVFMDPLPTNAPNRFYRAVVGE